MTVANYALRTNDTVMTHADWQHWLLHDSDELDDLQIDAFVASGDCFALLANDLDQLALSLDPDGTEYFRLQRAINILLYLQDNYKISRQKS